MLVGISDHHHNACHILELLSQTQRGCYLSRGAGFLLLKRFMCEDDVEDNEELSNVEVNKKSISFIYSFKIDSLKHF